MNSLKMILVLFFAFCPLAAQNYFSFGSGFSSVMVNSDDMDELRDTYNYVNRDALAQYLEGVGTVSGPQFEVGYYRLKRLSMATVIGWESLSGIDKATYGDVVVTNDGKDIYYKGDERILELKVQNFFVEYQLGYSVKNYFIHGVTKLFFKRNLTIDNRYRSNQGNPGAPFTGTYKADCPYAFDVGVSLGLVKRILLINLKLSYPVHTGGKSNYFYNKQGDEGFNYFPSNYIDYINNVPYHSVAGNLDGLKILLNFSVLIPSGKQK